METEAKATPPSRPASQYARRTRMTEASLKRLFEVSSLASPLSAAAATTPSFVEPDVSEAAVTPRVAVDDGAIDSERRSLVPLPPQRKGRGKEKAAQTEMGAAEFGLAELVFRSPAPGVVTAAHGRDRQLLWQQFDHRQIDLIGDERYCRVQIFVQQRDFIDMMWKAFCSTVPRRSAKSFAKLLLLRPPSGGSNVDRGDIAPYEASIGDSTEDWGMETPRRHDMQMQQLVRDNHELREKILILEKRVELKVAQIIPKTIKAAATVTPLLERTYSSSQFHAVLNASMSALLDGEAHARQVLHDALESAFHGLRAQWDLSYHLAQQRAERRVIVLPPFNGYRPKVPVENAFSAEEYLKRLITAEHFQHREDTAILLQRFENTARNAIDDERRLFIESAFAVSIVPLLTRRIAILEQETAALREKNDSLTAAVHRYSLEDKLKMLVSVEQETRQMGEGLWYDMDSILGQVRARLDGVGALSQQIGVLKRTLHEQGMRYKRELAICTLQIDEARNPLVQRRKQAATAMPMEQARSLATRIRATVDP